MPRKIALVTSGAVSLGSYEAGVLSELFTIFRLLAENWVKNGNNLNDIDYEVDVIAGASAGSINSAIYGLASVYNPDLIEFMRKIWVEGLDIAQLMGKGSMSKYSIFSDQVIEDLKSHLAEAVGTPKPGPLPDRVEVGMTLTNLSGIPYTVYFPHLKKDYKLTTFADWYPFELRRESKDADEIKKMIDAAGASGAFPFAFPARKLTRPAEFYANTALPVKNNPDFEFVYVDGGIFNNEPVNRAKELAQELSEKYLQETGSDGMDNRIYLLVDPTPPEQIGSFNEDPDMLAVAQRLVPAILSEAHFRDWNDAIKINQRLIWQDKFLQSIRAHLVAMDSAALAQINNSLSSLAEEIAQFKSKPAHSTQEKVNLEFAKNNARNYISKNEERIRTLLQKNELLRGGSPAMLDTALTKLMFVMECVGALRAKIGLDIRPIFPAANNLLAGRFWGSFGGFLSQELRQHDFDVGRLTARNFATAKNDGGLGLDLAPIAGQLTPISAINDKLKGNIEDVPLKCRIALRDMLLARSKSALGELIWKHKLIVFSALVVLSSIILVFNWLLKLIHVSALIRFPVIIVLLYFITSACIVFGLKKVLNNQLCIKKG